MMPFPKPRYEVRKMDAAFGAWDTERLSFVIASSTQYQHEAQRTVDALNREYQRWLTDRFYDRLNT